MTNMINIKGQKFGLLTALEPKGKAKDGSITWLVSCDCGLNDTLEVSGSDLRRGRKKSCGCLHANRADLLGKTFGKLRVVDYQPKTANTPFLWRCTRDCGETTFAKTVDLTSGSKRSCGCLKSPSLIGQKFGLLTVVGKLDEKKYNYNVWEVRCDCGNPDVAITGHLTSGSKKSCGCLPNRVEDLSGTKRNLLTVIEMADFRSSNNEVLWKCLCDCGEDAYVTRDKLLSDHTKSCGCLKDLRLEKHPNWQGGVSLVTKFLRRNLKEWKRKSLETTDFRCVISNERGRLIVHHANPDKPFHKIVKEAFEITEIEYQRSLDYYTKDQIEKLVMTCSELHFRYGLGIPLTKELHQEFHKIYGYIGWTNEDFERFVKGKESN